MNERRKDSFQTWLSPDALPRGVKPPRAGLRCVFASSPPAPPYLPYVASIRVRGSFPPRFSPSVTPSSALACISTSSRMSLKGASPARLVLQVPHLFGQLPVWGSRWSLRVDGPRPWTVLLPAPVLGERWRHLFQGTNRSRSHSETLYLNLPQPPPIRHQLWKNSPSLSHPADIH